MTQDKPITIEDIAAVAGTGPRTTRRLVREGIFPGRIVGRRYVCTPGEFRRWRDDDEWKSLKQEPATINPIVRRRTEEPK